MVRSPGWWRFRPYRGGSDPSRPSGGGQNPAAPRHPGHNPSAPTHPGQIPSAPTHHGQNPSAPPTTAGLSSAVKDGGDSSQPLLLGRLRTLKKRGRGWSSKGYETVVPRPA